MTRFRSKPQEVEAIQWNGANADAIRAFIGTARLLSSDNAIVCGGAVMGRRTSIQLLAGKDGAQGFVPVPLWHWIVRSPDNHSDVWPVDPTYFAAKYEKA